MTPRKPKNGEDKFSLPENPVTLEEAEAALAHAKEAYAQTPKMWEKQKEASDLFVDTILKAIAERGM